MTGNQEEQSVQIINTVKVWQVVSQWLRSLLTTEDSGSNPVIRSTFNLLKRRKEAEKNPLI